MSYAPRRYDRGGRGNYYNSYNNNSNHYNLSGRGGYSSRGSHYQPRGYHDNSYNNTDNDGNINDSVITCAFYNKIGACRHGEKCSKKHIKLTTSKTLLLANLYQNPKLNKNETEELSEKQIQEQFELFYQDIFIHLAKMSQVYDLVVCENENNHLNGNVYVQFTKASDASMVNTSLNQEWFNGRPVHSDLSPVTDFHYAHCRAYDTNSCERGEMCNYMHIRQASAELKELLFKAQDKMYTTVQLEKLKKLLIEANELGYAHVGGEDKSGTDKMELDEDDEDDEDDELSNQDAKKLLSQLF